MNLYKLVRLSVMIRFEKYLTVIRLMVIMSVMNDVHSVVHERLEPMAADESHSCLHICDAESIENQLIIKDQNRMPDHTPSVTTPRRREYESAKSKFIRTKTNESHEYRSVTLRKAIALLGLPQKNEPAGPALIDWRTSWTYPKVRNQNKFGRCGCCWAIAAVGALEILYSLQHQTRTQFSIQLGSLLLGSILIQELIDCCPDTNGCRGGKSSKAIEYLADFGVTSEENYPFRGYKKTCNAKFQIIARAETYQRIKNNDEAIVKALEKSPLVVSLHITREIFFYKKGVIDPAWCSNAKKACTHAVVIVGHGEDYWIVRNSWGKKIGDLGHYLLKKGTCGVGHKVWSVTLGHPARNQNDYFWEMTQLLLNGTSGIIKTFILLKKSGICS